MDSSGFLCCQGTGMEPRPCRVCVRVRACVRVCVCVCVCVRAHSVVPDCWWPQGLRWSNQWAWRPLSAACEVCSGCGMFQRQSLRGVRFKAKPWWMRMSKYGKNLEKRLPGVGKSKCPIMSSQPKKNKETLKSPQGKTTVMIKGLWIWVIDEGEWPASIHLPPREKRKLENKGFHLACFSLWRQITCEHPLLSWPDPEFSLVLGGSAVQSIKWEPSYTKPQRAQLVLATFEHLGKLQNSRAWTSTVLWDKTSLCVPSLAWWERKGLNSLF